MEKYFNGVKVDINDNNTISYADLSRIVGDCILNNDIHGCCDEDWELISAWDGESDLPDVYQQFIINPTAAEWLTEHTDEIVYYNHAMNLYLWGVTHWGTAWTMVYAEIK